MAIKTFAPDKPDQTDKLQAFRDEVKADAGAKAEPAKAEVRMQPATFQFTADLGQGLRNTIPKSVVPGWSRPENELTFEMRQLTIAEQCRARRVATRGGQPQLSEYERRLTAYAVRKVGDHDNPGDDFMDRWLADLGKKGRTLLMGEFSQLMGVTVAQAKAVADSERPDHSRRRYTYTLPASALPPRRWAAHVGLQGARWTEMVPENEGEPAESMWLVEGEPATAEQAALLTRDLTFTMQELTMEQELAAADAIDDPDDAAALRFMQALFSVVKVGDEVLGTSPDDLARKLVWLEAIGPRCNLIVTGTYAQLHEVAHGVTAEFRGSSTALE